MRARTRGMHIVDPAPRRNLWPSGPGLLIRCACISILKHDEWSRYGDFGGERRRHGAGETRKERRQRWKLYAPGGSSRPSHHENRCLADLRLRTDYYVFLTRHRLNLNIELCSPIRSSRHANFRLTTPHRIQLICIQIARFQLLASWNAVNITLIRIFNLLSENFTWSHFHKKYIPENYMIFIFVKFPMLLFFWYF